MVYVTPLFLLAVLVGWLVTEGWKTLLMIKIVDGAYAPLYTPSQVPGVMSTRLFALALVVGTGILVSVAWRRRNIL
jgi:hypothetical protein